jgi:hypothetical protein
LWLFYALLMVVAVGIFFGYSYFLNQQAEDVSVLPNTPAEAAKSAQQTPPAGS